jgi:aminomethyltransferase
MKEVLGIDGSALEFYTFMDIEKDGEKMVVSRTGYTGEDGFEVYSSHASTVRFWKALMAAGVQACGLGCRDTLRFEAGLPLYGDELTADITPVEAALSMFCKLDKEEFIGKEVVAKQKAEGVSRKSVGLEIQGPAIARHGYEVLDADDNVIGEVTTGYRSITLDKNLAMAMVKIDNAKVGTEVKVRVRRKVFPAVVVKKRFYTPNYKK